MSVFPCETENTKIQCKSYQDNYIFIPSVKNNYSCTGIFNLTSMSWLRLRFDDRIPSVNGTLDFWHGNENKVIYLGM